MEFNNGVVKGFRGCQDINKNIKVIININHEGSPDLNEIYYCTFHCTTAAMLQAVPCRPLWTNLMGVRQRGSFSSPWLSEVPACLWTSNAEAIFHMAPHHPHSPLDTSSAHFIALAS